VQARNAQLKMTVSVLTDKEGRYVVENLPAGTIASASGRRLHIRGEVRPQAHG